MRLSRHGFRVRAQRQLENIVLNVPGGIPKRLRFADLPIAPFGDFGSEGSPSESRLLSAWKMRETRKNRNLMMPTLIWQRNNAGGRAVDMPFLLEIIKSVGVFSCISVAACDWMDHE